MKNRTCPQKNKIKKTEEEQKVSATNCKKPPQTAIRENHSPLPYQALKIAAAADSQRMKRMYINVRQNCMFNVSTNQTSVTIKERMLFQTPNYKFRCTNQSILKSDNTYQPYQQFFSSAVYISLLM